MKLRQMVQQHVSDRVDNLQTGEVVTQARVYNIAISAWVTILDELSDEIFKLAGNGLPIQGQRRIAKALGIPAPEAPEQKLNDKVE